MLTPTIASVLTSQEIIFAFLIQDFVMGMVPSSLSVVGGGLVVLCAIFIPLEGYIVPHLPYNWMRSVF
jgi:hypothetical protein